MGSLQIRDVIRIARGFHQRLAVLYQTAGDQTTDERLRMLLYYMSRHEENLEACLTKYEREGAVRVLNAWIRPPQTQDLASALSRVRFGGFMAIEQIIESALGVDEALVAYYRCLSERAETEESRDLFSALHEMERRHEGQLVRDAMELVAG